MFFDQDGGNLEINNKDILYGFYTYIYKFLETKQYTSKRSMGQRRNQNGDQKNFELN